MAFLGHTARVVVGSTDLKASASAWEAVGFDVQDGSEHAVRLTDGQILLTILQEAVGTPALAYFHADPARLQQQLQAAGSPPVQTRADGFDLSLVDVPVIHVHARPADQADEATGGRNPVLGFLDALCVPAENARSTRRNLEQMGFFVQQEWDGPPKRSDVTDGLITLSFQEARIRPHLAYATEITADVLEQLTSIPNVTAEPVSLNDELAFVRLIMPERTRIVIAHDDNYE